MIRDRGLKVFILSAALIAVFGAFRTNWSGFSRGNIHPFDISRRTRAREKRFWVLKTHGPSVCDMAVMGDSRAYSDISPAAMQNGWSRSTRHSA